MVLPSEGQWLVQKGWVLGPGVDPRRRAAGSVSELGWIEKCKYIFIDLWPVIVSTNAKHSFIPSFNQ